MDFMAQVMGANTVAASLGNAGLRASAQAPKVLAKTAADVTADAQELAPVDTGNLKNSIGWELENPTEAVVGPTAEYGIHVELGTATQGPQAFLGPAFDRHVPSFVDAIAALADL